MPLLRLIHRRSVRPIFEEDQDSSTHTVDQETTTTSSAKLSRSNASSCCSTTTLNSTTSSEESTTATRVRFNLEANTEHSIDYSDVDLRCRWYLSDEVNYFKEETAHFGKQVEQEERGSPNSYTQALIKTYKACCETTITSGGEIMPKACPLGPGCKRKLRRWLEVSTDRLGAELSCVRFLRQQKRNRHREMVSLVLEHQARSRSGAAAPDTRSLGERCEQVSLPGRMFARTMAEAYYYEAETMGQ